MERLQGLLVGTAVGDSLGLPAEGLSARRIRKLWPGECRHHLLFGRGMVSDDTEHTIFVAQALLSENQPEAFARHLAMKLRWWLLGLPAGIGFATLRSIMKLWVGFPPSQSGVCSAGNGPAMRSAIIGAVFPNDPGKIDDFVRCSTQMTHTDERALTGARAVAHSAGWAMRQDWRAAPDIPALLANLKPLSEDSEWRAALSKVEAALQRHLSVEDFAVELGCANRVSGYVFHTVPVALYAWLRHWGDFRAAVSSAIQCGGDTDTVGAICGALAGCCTGRSGIPADWVNGICDWPRSMALLEKIGVRLATQHDGSPVRYFWPGTVPRNLLFLLVVLFHALKRALPPY
jgi:ADP-ribosylglycohydrolase